MRGFNFKSMYKKHIDLAKKRGCWQTNLRKGAQVSCKKNDHIFINVIGRQKLYYVGKATTNMKEEPVKKWLFYWIDPNYKTVKTVYFTYNKLWDLYFKYIKKICTISDINKYKNYFSKGGVISFKKKGD